ncbi:DNA-directed RNA polymerase subunit omega [candidate division KSB1 bacterium]|nr:DNA-directed RNA polymerase subunit omega [candidate division KSB1 bacterium]
MAQTLPLDELEKYADNVYEAIVMIAKRARQINDLQKRRMEKEMEMILQNTTFDDENVSQDVVDHQYLKLPNPTTIALQEMLDGKLTRDYPQVDEE